NLMLARTVTRQKEIAIRAALGATRWQVFRLLITESVLLGVLGGLVGCVLCLWTLDTLGAQIPVSFLKGQTLGVDGRVLAFTGLLGVGTGVLFGLVPGLGATRHNLHDTLKQAGRSAGGHSHGRLRSALVVTEVALALMLLVCAGLLMRSF